MNNINYLEGYLETIEASKNLHITAELASKKKFFGIACSLNILSSEEAIKSNFMLISHFLDGQEIEGFSSLFVDHKFKHDQLKAFFKWKDTFIDLIKEVDLNREKELSERGYSKTDIAIINKKDKYFMAINTKLEKIESQKTVLNEAINWFDSANNNKNDGLYVKIKKNTWHSPNNFKEKDFLKSKKYTKSIIELNELCYDIVTLNDKL
jgi:AbiV family abortive infection protein